MIRINNIKVGIGEEKSLSNMVKKRLGTDDFYDLKIVKKAIDARKKNDIKYIYSVDVKVNDEKHLVSRLNSSDVCIAEEYKYIFPEVVKKPKVVVVGSGPAGLFCALELSKAGVCPVLLERGKCVKHRKKDIERFWKTGKLDENSNVQFGEGGAGTFSDGKLTTGIKDKRIREVLSEFVRFGAPEEIEYLAKPHIGTDNLQKIVRSMREEIISLGGEVRFSSMCYDLKISDGKVLGVYVKDGEGEYLLDADCVVLATGHSSTEVFEMLESRGVELVQKPFSVGVRIEHPQSLINKSQYGDFASQLPPADYKLSTHLESGRSVYTFCMCPGGYVINSSSEQGGVVTNGMSNFQRDAENANSAVLVNVTPSDFENNNPLSGIDFKRKIEERAFIAGGKDYSVPVSLVGDFLAGRVSKEFGKVKPTIMPKTVFCSMDDIFPKFVCDSLREALPIFEKKIKGFSLYEAVISAPETRSSSPVSVVRNPNTHMTNIKGLFTAGEGGGHAGGITSSAVDGIKTAENVVMWFGGE